MAFIDKQKLQYNTLQYEALHPQYWELQAPWTFRQWCESGLSDVLNDPDLFTGQGLLTSSLQYQEVDPKVWEKIKEMTLLYLYLYYGEKELGIRNPTRWTELFLAKLMEVENSFYSQIDIVGYYSFQDLLYDDSSTERSLIEGTQAKNKQKDRAANDGTQSSSQHTTTHTQGKDKSLGTSTSFSDSDTKQNSMSYSIADSLENAHSVSTSNEFPQSAINGYDLPQGVGNTGFNRNSPDPRIPPSSDQKYLSNMGESWADSGKSGSTSSGTGNGDDHGLSSGNNAYLGKDERDTVSDMTAQSQAHTTLNKDTDITQVGSHDLGELTKVIGQNKMLAYELPQLLQAFRDNMPLRWLRQQLVSLFMEIY